LVHVPGRRQILRRCAPRNALDRFDRRSYSLGIGFGPAKIAGEPLKKLFDLMAFDGAFEGVIIPLVLLWFVPLWIVRLWIGRIWMVCAHGNLMADIVGEFAPWRTLNLNSASESVERRYGQTIDPSIALFQAVLGKFIRSVSSLGG
jgi:hypothetical protein